MELDAMGKLEDLGLYVKCGTAQTCLCGWSSSKGLYEPTFLGLHALTDPLSEG